MGSRKFSSLPLLYELADKGWLVITISYRFAPYVTYPDNLIDCKRALEWVKNNIEKYGGRKDYVIVGGESAGSQLSLLLSLSNDDKELNKDIKSDLTVQGCVDFYGATLLNETKQFLSDDPLLYNAFIYTFGQDETKYKDASPVDLIVKGKKLPPTIIVHGDCDEIVPFVVSTELDRVLKENKCESFLLKIPHGKHCFNYFISPRTYTADEIVSLYLDLQYKKYFNIN